jgi:hypothetical protein
MSGRAGLAALAALALGGAADADELPRCPLLPPVEEIEVAKLPPILIAALTRDVGQIALPGKPFDADGTTTTGVSHRLLWVRKQGTRWVVAVEEGGREARELVVSYEIGYDGSLAGMRKDVAFPATVCQLTERELWR